MSGRLEPEILSINRNRRIQLAIVDYDAFMSTMASHVLIVKILIHTRKFNKLNRIEGIYHDVEAESSVASSLNLVTMRSVHCSPWRCRKSNIEAAAGPGLQHCSEAGDLKQIQGWDPGQ